MDAIILLIFQALFPLFLIWCIAKCLPKGPKPARNLPPSPWKLPVIGNMHQLGLLPHRRLQALAQKHGPLMLLHFGSQPTLIVSSADAAREIMKTHDLTFANRPESSLTRRLLYDCKDVAVAPYGEYWRQLKSICVLQLLSSKRVQSFHSIREEETRIFMGRIEESALSGSSVNLSEMFTEITNDVVCRSAFGRKYREGDGGKKFLKMIEEYMRLLGSFNVGVFIPWLSWIDRVNGFDSRVEAAAREMDDFSEGVIEERLNNGVERRPENFVDILVGIYENQKSTGIAIDRDSIKALILDVFTAGTDTTSTVLEWAMSELLRHPDVMKKVQNEVRAVLNQKELITDQDLDRMPYLKAVIKETLRFHTPIPLLVPRTARNDATIKGFDVLAGTMVMINAWAIGRDPASWDEPEKFNPDRFLNSDVDYKGLHFELIPFGAGRRSCPGIAFAMATNELVLATMVRKFSWELADGVKAEDLDMSEWRGVAVRRAQPLRAIPIQDVF